MFSLTLLGLDNRTSESCAEITLATHIKQVVEYIEARNLQSVTLVGHSYSGVVVGAVADRIPTRITRLLLIEAALPVHGQSVLQSNGNNVREETRLIRENRGFWPHPNREELRHEPHLTPAQKDYLLTHFKPHPGRTVTEPVQLSQSTLQTLSLWLGRELPAAAKRGALANLEFASLDSGHWPMLSKPEEIIRYF